MRESPWRAELKGADLTASILNRRHWVFDLDGTLTQAILDFAEIKRRLGLPPDQDILTSLAQMGDKAEPLRRKLADIEFEMAGKARVAEGAEALLKALRERKTHTGILTRNRRSHALETLRVIGLAPYFEEIYVLGRDEAKHKPDPDGLLKLLQAWNADPGDAVMAGDYVFDLEAGRRAGAATVYVDPSGAFPYRHIADVSVARLDDLLA